MRLSKILAALVISAFAGLGLQAQNRTVSGMVLDAQGLAVPGVGVVLEGTSTGTMTGADGSYSLRVPAREVVLVFSSLGYVTQNVTVAATQDKVNVTLLEDNMTLEETVVVG
ncbi:MAG: carboxypeptidase-like regulatory domain-containing protein, partial [Bacteroidales bacterium]|nr:carboxypeptidase-like regulatory domain-containing protein [Bacteroidales bacterium]